MRIRSKFLSMGPPIVSNHPDLFGEIVVLQRILLWVWNWLLRMLPYRVRLWNRALLPSFRVTSALVMFQFSIATETGWAVEPVILSSVINASPKARLTLPPTALASSRSEPIDLSGQWSWKGAWRAGDALPDESTIGWFPIQIPSEYEQKGMKVDQKAALYRTCVVPETWRGNRVKMRFDAVNNAMTLRINGVEVGKHDGFLLPFEFDVTDHLRYGSTNQILVELVELGVRARMSARLRQGGIIRKVSLFAVPSVNITECYSETQFDPKFRDAKLKVIVGLSNDQAGPADGHRIRIRFREPSGRTMESKEVLQAVPSLPGLSSARQTVELDFAAPARWDSDHPNLYEMTVSLEMGEAPIETVTRKIGFCQTEVVGNQVKVNGTPIKVRGILRFDQFKNEGSAVPEEIDVLDPILFRNANCNYLRSWPASDSFYDSCDEAGVFVHGEMPISFQGVVPEGTTEDFLKAADELLNHVRHHPSVIFWSLGNESEWSQPFSDLARYIRRQDPNRPIFECQPFGNAEWPLLNLDAVHYPLLDLGGYTEWYRPVLFTEYHHVNTESMAENIRDPGVRDYWGGVFQRMWEKMYAAPSILGGCVFAGVDYQDPQYGELPWGVVDHERRPKPEYWHLKKVYSPVQIRQETAPLIGETGQVEVMVENRHDFSNLSELKSEWRIGSRSGDLTIDLPSRKSGFVRIPVKPEDAGEDLWLRFLDARGFMVDEYRLPIGTRRATPAWRKAGTNGAKLARIDPNTVSVEAGAATWVIDESKGRIVSGRWNGIEVMKGGPDFWITGLDTKGWPGWHVESRQADQTVEVRVTTDAPEGQRVGLSPFGITGTLTYRFMGDGNLDVDYRLTWDGGFNWWHRELGMAFSVSSDCSDWSWQRKALWSVYPASHIGRPSGKATLNRDPSWTGSVVNPIWPGSLDEFGGTADFRSTKYGILNAAITRPDRIGIVVESDGKQAARMVAGINGEHQLVVNELSGIGSEQTLVRVFPEEAFQMVPGKRFSGRVRISLAELPAEALNNLVPNPSRPDLRLVRTAFNSYRIRSVGPIQLHPRIQRSQDLINWKPATNTFFLDGESIEVQIPSSGGNEAEFYRAAP